MSTQLEELQQIAVGRLMPDPTQPRKSFLNEELQRLAASVAARGILQPLRVSYDAKRDSWLIITGESRFRAACLAGLESVPCIVVQGQPDEADLLADRVIENAVRSDLSPLDFARALAKLKLLKNCNSQALAVELGLSSASITRAESLLSLPEDVQELINIGSVPASAGYEISRLPSPDSQREMAQLVAAKRIKRDAVAEAVRDTVGRRQARPKDSRLAVKLGGMSFSVTAEGPLEWDSFIAAIGCMHREAKKLSESGKEVRSLADVLKSRHGG